MGHGVGIWELDRVSLRTMASGSGRPVREPHPRDISCQTRTRNAAGADATVPCTFAYGQNPFDGALRPTMRAAKYSMRPSEPSNAGDQGCLALVGAAGEAEGSAACISTRSEIRRA